MKNVLKRNQIMITALAIMIAVAGYLNFAGTKAGEEQLTSAQALEGEEDMTALLDLSEEDIVSDIQSMDSEQDGVAAADYLEEQMEADALAAQVNAEVSILGDSLEEANGDVMQEAAQAGAEAAAAAGGADQASADGGLTADSGDVTDGEVPGEAVFTSSTGLTSLAGAKLQKEQTRARNKETLLDIINNGSISEEQKADAINGMIALTDMAEKETAAEILLEAKGFSDVVVSISGSTVDVVVNASSLTDAQRARIEDIVARKTGIAPENIVISPVQ